jgi:hypothetical protein
VPDVHRERARFRRPCSASIDAPDSMIMDSAVASELRELSLSAPVVDVPAPSWAETAKG